MAVITNAQVQAKVDKTVTNMDRLDRFVNGRVNEIVSTDNGDSLTVLGIGNQVILNRGGLEPPVNYAAGLTIARTSQTVNFNGNIYAPTGALPYTTPATFDTTRWYLVYAPTVVSTRAILKTLSAAAVKQLAFLTETGREGLFRWDGSVSTTVHQADTAEGIYVPPTAGAAGAWVRQWDGINGLPEWFGAVKGGSDCFAAITACLKLCPVTLLTVGDYFISDTVRVPPYRTLEGAGSYRAQSGVGTRVVITSGTKDALAVGLANNPQNINSHAKNSVVRHLAVSRSVAVTPVAIGSNRNAAAGIRMQFALNCTLYDVYADEHSIGFYFNGVVHSFIKECVAFRSTNGTGTTNDFFFGFWAFGSGNYGLSGGNGSVFLIDCNASVGGSPTLSEDIGFNLTHAYADTFLVRPEVASMTVGIQLDGQNEAAAAAHLNVSIEQPEMDGIKNTGIVVKNTNGYGGVQIYDAYVALTSTGQYGILLDSATGVTVVGGRLAGYAASDALGYFANNCRHLRLDGLALKGFGRPVGVVGSSEFTIDVDINNPAQAASQAAVALVNCSLASVACTVSGGANFPQGIHLQGTGNVRVSVDPTRVNPAAVTGGAANKVRINNVQITAAGSYGSDGSAGTAIVVAGVVG